LPQRPEVSSKQATPLPLPNRLRQPRGFPINPIRANLRLLSAYICVNLMPREPVLPRAFELQTKKDPLFSGSYVPWRLL